MRAVLDRLSDFARRITEIGNRAELYSPTVIRIVSSKLEPELYYECERWMRYHQPTEELSVNRIVQFLRAETEARERLTPVRSARVEKPTYSMNHVSALTFADPCIFECGVHHKFIDCLAFRSKQPWQRRDRISRAGRCFSCFCRQRLPKSEALQWLWWSTPQSVELWNEWKTISTRNYGTWDLEQVSLVDESGIGQLHAPDESWNCIEAELSKPARPIPTNSSSRATTRRGWHQGCLLLWCCWNQANGRLRLQW